MAKRETTYSAKLSIEMAKIDTCFALVGQMADDLPESDAKMRILRLVEEGRQAGERAADHLVSISAAASTI